MNSHIRFTCCINLNRLCRSINSNFRIITWI
nr:MAG TPA: hypothetical protein [Bacteriophage sp.]